MVLVDPSYRHRGIATHLVRQAVDYLTRRSVRTIRLDATPSGRPVYARMGFGADYELVRFHGTAKRTPREPNHPPTGELIGVPAPDAILGLDHRAAGTRRKRLLQRLLREFPSHATAMWRGSQPQGFVLFRPGSEAFQIGPMVALDPQTGMQLGDWVIDEIQGSAVFVDIPLANTPAVEWARARGLIEQRRFWRMSRGQPVVGDPAILWTSSGPEKG
jgi:hypothetical protein